MVAAEPVQVANEESEWTDWSFDLEADDRNCIKNLLIAAKLVNIWPPKNQK